MVKSSLKRTSSSLTLIGMSQLTSIWSLCVNSARCSKNRQRLKKMVKNSKKKTKRMKVTRKRARRWAKSTVQSLLMERAKTKSRKTRLLRIPLTLTRQLQLLLKNHQFKRRKSRKSKKQPKMVILLNSQFKKRNKKSKRMMIRSRNRQLLLINNKIKTEQHQPRIRRHPVRNLNPRAKNSKKSK